MVQTAASLNKNSFCQHPHATPFCINNNLRENRFFCGKVNDWWAKRALIMLKFLLKIRQRRLCRVRAQRATATASTYVYNRQRKRLPRMQLTTNGRLHQANAEVIGHRQMGFDLYRTHQMVSPMPPF